MGPGIFEYDERKPLFWEKHKPSGEVQEGTGAGNMRVSDIELP
jgi:hypothetical protein